MTDHSALIERLEAHMGKADMAEVLSDCRLAAAALRDLTEWRDISTAPRDGTAIMVFGGIRRFSDPPHMGVRERGTYGWREPNISAHDLDDWLDDEKELTHWLPLPSAPNQAKASS